MQQAEHPAPPGLEQTLRRYLTLAQTCHELFAVTFGEDHPPEHAAMDELLRALRQAHEPAAPSQLNS
jgi:hypothetical protein